MRGVSLLSHSNKRGYILIYTLLVGCLCLILAVFSLNMALKQRKYAESIQKYVLKNNVLQEYKENLFTMLNHNLHNNINHWEQESIENFLSSYTDGIVASYKESRLVYDRNQKLFNIQSAYDVIHHREDTYSYHVIENKIEYTYIKTSYVPGRIGQ